MNFKDKVAVITGGARGIGKEIALAFARAGAHCVLCDMNKDELEAAIKDVEAAGSQALAVELNVVSLAQCEAMVNKIIDKFGKIDILINNAGITKDGLLLRMREEDWDAVLAVNLKGTFNCTKAAIRVMLKQRYGRIVNVASIIGVMGNAGQANYAASKAGIIGFTKSVAKEVASRNITVNAIAPGFIATKMTDVLSEDVKTAMLKQIPLARFGTPEDVARLVLFLASDDAGYITGQVVQIDGGMLM